MSYTLNGRAQTRLVSAALPLLVALGTHRWWAIELVALMLAIGLALDLVYDRVISYQPAWLALPLGALELGLVYLAMRRLGVMASLRDALLLYGLAWLSAQLFAHAILPRLRLEYAESGGEPGRVGALTAAAVAITAVCGVGGAYAVRPPTVHLHGTVQGPLVIRHAQTLIGGVVRGGIEIRADHVTLKDVTIVGGEYGVDIEHAQHVMLDRVRILHFKMDAIRALDAGVMIDRCSVTAPASAIATGVLISYSMGRPMSMISRCTIVGTREGISTHSSMVDVRDNHVVGTTVRGISLSEMSMDSASGNQVESPNGIGIVCMDHSVCEIEHNTIAGARMNDPDDPSAAGVAIESYFYAQATLRHNTVIASPGGVRALDEGTIETD
jgi:Right handed beta helix region